MNYVKDYKASDEPSNEESSPWSDDNQFQGMPT